MELYPVQFYNEAEDYKDIVKWTASIDQIIPDPEMLPAVGVVAIKDGVKIGCGFLFLSTDCPVAVLEWVHFNPESRASEKIIALNSIIKSLEMCAKEENASIIFAGSPTNSITRLYVESGYTAMARNMTHLVKVIN